MSETVRDVVLCGILAYRTERGQWPLFVDLVDTLEYVDPIDIRMNLVDLALAGEVRKVDNRYTMPGALKTVLPSKQTPSDKLADAVSLIEEAIDGMTGPEWEQAKGAAIAAMHSVGHARNLVSLIARARTTEGQDA